VSPVPLGYLLVPPRTRQRLGTEFWHRVLKAETRNRIQFS
jgi:hypothetical protein